jgi:small subunit ribosomal protein S2
MSKYKLPKIEELLSAGVHFGHQVRRWHPKMEPYIYGVKNNIHILDLETTEKGLKKACEFLFDIASKGGQIIFVGTKKQARDIVQLEATRSGALFITERWLGGTITNYRVIKKNTDKLVDLIKKREANELTQYTKKERLLIDREIEKGNKYYGGIVTLKGAPAALFVVDTKREKTAIKEAAKAGVPVVALVDTNSDPREVTHVIPGNDDAIKSIALILKSVSSAVEEGYKEFASKSEQAPVKEVVAASTVILEDEKAAVKAEKTKKSEEPVAKAKPAAKKAKTVTKKSKKK